MKRLPLVADFVLLIALCMSSVYWALQLFNPQAPPAAVQPQAASALTYTGDAAGLFGGRRSGAAVGNTFQLKGVIAAGPDSVAILVEDGKPPQAVGVNAETSPGVTVKEVHQQYVLLNESGVVKRVDLPESANTGLKRDNLASTTSSGLPIPGPIMHVGSSQMPSQPPLNRRPSGIGPGAFGPLPTPMPSPDHGLADPNRASIQNPLIAKSAK